MAFVPDANIWIALSKRDRSVERNIFGYRSSETLLSTLVEAELYFGAAKSTRRLEVLARLEEQLAPFDRLPFCSKAAHSYGQIRAYLAAVGRPVGNMDLLIAASALAHGHTVVTRNVREFETIPGLSLETW